MIKAWKALRHPSHSCKLSTYRVHATSQMKDCASKFTPPVRLFVTISHFGRVAQGCKLLRAVAAGNNSNITDGGVDALVRGNTLVHLDLRNCMQPSSLL